MRLSRILPLSLTLAGWGACTGRTEAPRVVVVAHPISSEAARGESVASVESGDHVIEVRRTIRVPDRCRRIAGDLRETGPKITLRIVAAPTRRACRPSESYLAYTARIEGLSTGRYELRVVHAPLRAPGRAETALEHPLVVMESAVLVR